MLFLASLLVNGALAGAVYALISLAFVVVYKSSRTMNFALGEWVMVASRLVAAGLGVPGVSLASAIAMACAGMVGLAVVFNGLVLRRMAGSPVISLLMVTLGLGAFLRGAAPVLLRGAPGALRLPGPLPPLDLHGIVVPAEKLVAAGLAALCIAAVSWLFQRSRAGVALRAMADDPQAAMTVGIDINRYVSISWALAGVLAVAGGVLWAVTVGGGFGLALVGLKVFPIVVLGGLDSIPGTIVGAIVLGVLESLVAGYVDPVVGAGFSSIAGYLVLLAVLLARPYGLLGRADVARV